MPYDRESLENERHREGEARYRAIVEDQPELVCRFRPDGTLSFANASYCRFFGIDRERVVGHRYTPVLHPEDVPRVEALLATLGPDHRVVSIDNRVLRGDGEIRWTRWTNHALFDAEGKLVEYQSTGRDITEQKQAEDAAARLAAIVEGAEDAILSKSFDGTIMSWNRAAEQLFGFSSDEAVGQPISIIVPPDRLDEELALLSRLEGGETARSFETERVRKDGSRIPVLLTVSPIRDASGRAVGASTIARDISERLRAERDLKASVETLEILYRLSDALSRAGGRKEVSEAAVDAVLSVAAADRASVLVFDEDGVMRFTAWRGLSKAYRAAVDGHSPWSRDSKNPSPIVVGDVAEDPDMEDLRDVISLEGIRALGFIPLVYRGRLLGKFMIYYDDPHEFTAEEMRLAATVAQHVSFSLARVDSDAAVERLLERERSLRNEADAARHAAERANAEKDEFLAMLAHELRNPLSVIGNAITVLETTKGLRPGSERVGQMIGRQVEHLARLLDDLLDVARITRGRFELQQEVLDLRQTVKTTVEAQSHRIQAKQQCVSLALPAEPVRVSGDPARLQQVLGNLVNNASKYTGRGGSIEIGLEEENGEAVLRVLDDGVGISPEDLEAVFEPFAQANPELARAEGGLGLGLTLVRRVVELHGGTVRASSEGHDRGTELTVRLPLAARDESSERRRAAESPATNGASRRVLVIEDNDDGREMLVALLQLYGHRVVGAGTGKEGIEAALRQRPEIVIVDIGLPDIGGFEVATELRRRFGDRMRLVALTGYGQPGDRARSEASGFDAHLVKPVEPPVLLQTMERLMSAATV